MTVTTVVQAKTTLSNGNEVIPFQSTTITHVFTPVMNDTTIGTSYARESGDFILGYSSTTDTIPDTLMMTSLSEGKTWHNSTNSTALVVGQEDVTVVAGTYKNAWKIKYTSVSGSDTMEMFQWYAKGVGAVKTHYESSQSGYNMIFNQELTSSTIK
jgi:hypothetical protein